MRIYMLVWTVLLFGCSQPKIEVPIQVDSNWQSGELDNGLRYHFYSTEDQPVSIRMLVHVGSANESEQQKGYAHFLEHMAFNGSKNFQSNDVIKLFEDAGLTFGADLNAYTSYYETVYRLDLPNVEQLGKAAMWMRDIADQLTLSDAEIEKEKGVVLGEFRRTRLEHKPLAEKYYDELIKGTSLESLDPLGTKESVNSITSKSLSSFYQRWYQPNQTEVIISGGVTAQQAKAIVTEHFSSWQVQSDAAQTKSETAQLKLTDFSGEIGEFESPSLSVMIDRGPSRISNREQQHQMWLDEVVLQLVGYRLNARFNSEAVPLQSLYSSPYYVNYRRYGLVSVSFPAQDKSTVQQLFKDTYTSIRDYGVDQQELDAVLAYYQQLLSNSEHDWQQRDAVDLAQAKLNALYTGEVSQSLEDYQSSLTEFLQQATLESVNQALNAMLGQEFSLILGAETQELALDYQADIPNIRQTLIEKGDKPLALESTVSELAQPSQVGTIVSKVVRDDGFVVWTLSNGVEVWFERDEEAGDTVNFIYASQGGRSALDRELYPTSVIAINAMTRSGVGDFNGAQFDSFLRKDSIGVIPFVNFSHHGVEVFTPKERLADSLNILFNVTTNANIDQRQLETVAREQIQQAQNYFSSPIGQWNREITKNTFLPTSQHYVVTAPEIAMVTVDDVKAAYSSLFAKNRDNKLVIIGDISHGQLDELLKRYVASIPLQQSEVVNYEAEYKLDPQSRIDLAVNNENSSFYLLRVTNPNARVTTAKTAFMDDMLQRLLAKRLNHYVREELSLDYSPTNFPVAHDREPSSDWFIEAQVAPSDIEKIEPAIDKVVADLLSNVTQSDLDHVAKQLAVALEPLKDDNPQRAWFYTRYLIHDLGLEAIMDTEAFAHSITLDEFKARIEEVLGDKSMKTKYTLTPE